MRTDHGLRLSESVAFGKQSKLLGLKWLQRECLVARPVYRSYHNKYCIIYDDVANKSKQISVIVSSRENIHFYFVALWCH